VLGARRGDFYASWCKSGLWTPQETVHRAACIRTESAQIKNFIDVRFVEPIGGRYLDNIKPSN